MKLIPAQKGGLFTEQNLNYSTPTAFPCNRILTCNFQIASHTAFPEIFFHSTALPHTIAYFHDKWPEGECSSWSWSLTDANNGASLKLWIWCMLFIQMVIWFLAKSVQLLWSVTSPDAVNEHSILLPKFSMKFSEKQNILTFFSKCVCLITDKKNGSCRCELRKNCMCSFKLDEIFFHTNFQRHNFHPVQFWYCFCLP